MTPSYPHRDVAIPLFKPYQGGTETSFLGYARPLLPQFPQAAGTPKGADGGRSPATGGISERAWAPLTDRNPLLKPIREAPDSLFGGMRLHQAESGRSRPARTGAVTVRRRAAAASGGLRRICNRDPPAAPVVAVLAPPRRVEQDHRLRRTCNVVT